MDVDLLADILNDGQPVLSGNLLSHLSDRILTLDETAPAPISSLSRTVNSSQPGAVVSKIEDVFERLAGCILDEKMKISIQLKTRGKQSAIGRDSTTGTIKSLPDEKMRTVEFPSKSAKEAWKFSRSSRALTAALAYLEQLHCSGFSSCPTKPWSPALLQQKGFYYDPINLWLYYHFKLTRSNPTLKQHSTAYCKSNVL
jgi:hypothetical protein